MATSDPVAPASGPWRTIGLLAFAAAGFLLITMGGAIVAAPVTVPLIVIATFRHPTVSFRTAGALLVGLTVGEVAWALTYLAIREDEPWIWLVPMASGLTTAVALAVSTRST